MTRTRNEYTSNELYICTEFLDKINWWRDRREKLNDYPGLHDKLIISIEDVIRDLSYGKAGDICIDIDDSGKELDEEFYDYISGICLQERGKMKDNIKSTKEKNKVIEEDINEFLFDKIDSLSNLLASLKGGISDAHISIKLQITTHDSYSPDISLTYADEATFYSLT